MCCEKSSQFSLSFFVFRVKRNADIWFLMIIQKTRWRSNYTMKSSRCFSRTKQEIINMIEVRKNKRINRICLEIMPIECTGNVFEKFYSLLWLLSSESMRENLNNLFPPTILQRESEKFLGERLSSIMNVEIIESRNEVLFLRLNLIVFDMFFLSERLIYT